MGASTGIFGIFGTALGFLVFNWRNLEYEGSMRGVWMCQIAIIVVMSFLLTGGNTNVMAHVGGFVSGFFVGLWISEKFDRPGGIMVGFTPYEKWCRYSGYAVSFILFIVPLMVILFA
jgi:membrane associated rhomboid family serine protease